MKIPRFTKLETKTQVVCVARYSAQVEVTVVQVIRRTGLNECVS